MAVAYYRVLVAEDAPRGWSAVFPDLPGCATCGDTLNDALRMALDAAAGWIETTAEHGEAIPAPAPIDAPLPAWMQDDAEIPWGEHHRYLLPVDTQGPTKWVTRPSKGGKGAPPTGGTMKVRGPWQPPDNPAGEAQHPTPPRRRQ